MTAADVLLVALGGLAVGAGLLVVSCANVIRAGLWLVVALGALAGCFLVLSAEFVAWVQLLIYVGAVVVLLLFVTMLTRAPIGRGEELDRSRWPAVGVGGAAAATLVTLLVQAFGDVVVRLNGTVIGGAKRIGVAVFSGWVFGFELLSVILLAALISTIVVSRRTESE
ncbi:MAG: hypothetical protein DLM55_05340 [Acidimicrobiales bacterium]|nr:MAG: hypothetical protein DLM55_05340 [Acidimicrobiales bacterium]